LLQKLNKKKKFFIKKSIYTSRNLPIFAHIPRCITKMDAQIKFIGREKEQKMLLQLLETQEPDMVSIIGRRRVGKTFLVRKVYANHLDFEMIGIQNVTLTAQLTNFLAQLKSAFGLKVTKQKPKTWLDAFILLITALEAKNKQEKMVVFFDELSWLSTPKSGFLEALGFFWNSWASRKNIIVVICASAASWMIQKVVYNKGGLHNRITKRIDLQPFTLHETELFLRSRGVKSDRYHILQLYMAMGGIPHYLKEVEVGKSAAQNIDAICFASGGLLTDEFSKLYLALFEEADNHVAVIRALAQKRIGMNRSDIVKEANLSDGGGVTKVIGELVACGFIEAYYPFGKKVKDLLYRLTDEYSLFYLYFIEKNRKKSSGLFLELSQTQEWKSWSGYAFESICIKHLPQMKKSLSIVGVYSEASAFFLKGTPNQQGLQIDLVLDRKDQVINLFEMKFYNTSWTISKEDAVELKSKIERFKIATKTKKQVFLTLATTFGIKQNEHSLDLVDNEIHLDALFEP
jgi:uncharacterized protein